MAGNFNSALKLKDIYMHVSAMMKLSYQTSIILKIMCYVLQSICFHFMRSIFGLRPIEDTMFNHFDGTRACEFEKSLFNANHMILFSIVLRIADLF